MIDHSLVISPEAALVFHLKQGFFLYVWPMLIGFRDDSRVSDHWPRSG